MSYVVHLKQSQFWKNPRHTGPDAQVVGGPTGGALGDTGVRGKTEARTVRRGKRRSEEPRRNDVSSRRSRFDGGGSLCKETVKR